MPIEKKTLWIAVGFTALLLVAILLATGTISLTKKTKKVELTVWGFDTPRTWEKITTQYNAENPAMTITYRAISPLNYETELVNGMAAGTGPDIFMIMNTWLTRHGNKIAPAPQDIATTATVDALFPTTVAQEYTANGTAYALPLHMDTYALIYNKDIFDAAGITLPPNNWLALQDLVKKLGKNVIALGGSEKTIEGASDILALMMMQGGVPMTGSDGATKLTGGEGALSFYTKFASPKSGYYTWDNKAPSAFERFAQGKLMMLVGTHAEVMALRAANPALRIGIAPLPQVPDAPVNLATYAGLSVWIGSAQSKEAWQFIQDVTTVPENALLYATSANVPPAHRALIGQFENDPVIGVFARQALTARPWYRANEGVTRQTFSDMIESVLKGTTITNALRAAEQTLR